MGEGRRNRAAMLCQLANLPAHPESVPINLLVQVEGTCPPMPPMPFTLIPSGDCRGQQPGAPAFPVPDLVPANLGFNDDCRSKSALGPHATHLG
jgi:hypothetical protein